MTGEHFVGLFRIYDCGDCWGVWYLEDRNCAPVATFGALDVAQDWARRMSDDDLAGQR